MTCLRLWRDLLPSLVSGGVIGCLTSTPATYVFAWRRMAYVGMTHLWHKCCCRFSDEVLACQLAARCSDGKTVQHANSDETISFFGIVQERW